MLISKCHLNAIVVSKDENALGGHSGMPLSRNPTRTEAGKSQLKSDAMMDLNLDILSIEKYFIRIALSHYYKQNGDMIADPDMEIIINTKLKTANAMTYQDSMIFQSAEQGGGINQRLVGRLNDFLDDWLRNCVDQGHEIG